MTKVIITGAFEGQVVAMYGEYGVGENAKPPLLFIDYREAVLGDRGKEYLNSWIPLRYGEKDDHTFEQQFGSDKVKIVVVEEKMDFDRDFWEVYGIKENRIRAEKIWKNLKENERVLACHHLQRYLRFLARSTFNRAKASPSKYLAEKYWTTNWDERD